MTDCIKPKYDQASTESVDTILSNECGVGCGYVDLATSRFRALGNEIENLMRKLVFAEIDAIEKCEKACELERLLNEEQNEGDEAYNHGVKDCINALRALRKKASL